MSFNHYPLIGFCAPSGTGKTTLLSRLIPLLKVRGLRVAAIKHGHHQLELDQAGKDSYRFREAGAEQVVLSAQKVLARLHASATQAEASLADSLQLLDLNSLDLILVEGFKQAAFPKIELHRPALGKALLFPDDPHIIAIASDAAFEWPEQARPLPHFDLDDLEALVQFILGTLQLIPTTGSTEIRTAPSCADAREPGSLSLSAARQRIMDSIHPVQTLIKRPLRDALHHVLAEAVCSPFNVPSHTNSAMDGYALAGDDLPTDSPRQYRLIGTALAGNAFQGQCHPGECVRIMTGATLAAGTDTVVMQEQVETSSTDTEHWVRIGTGHRSGQNVRHAGEDISVGQSILHAGRCLTPADLGLLASLGLAEIKVHRPPRVAFFSTGDELRSIGETLEPGCVYDSNRYTLYGMLQQLGCEIIDLGVVVDQPQALRAAFQTAAACADVVISSGGVSVGEADYTRRILDELGQIDFWKIAIKPGRPLAFGQLGQAIFFGLPGNPVAVMVTFQQLVQPALLKLAGRAHTKPLLLQATCTQHLRKKAGRTEFLRAIYTPQVDGSLTVQTAGAQGSGILLSMSRANCYIILDEANAGVAAGTPVCIQPFSLETA